MGESFAARKPTHSQTAYQSRVDTKLAAELQELFESLLEFMVNIHEQSIGENARTRNTRLAFKPSGVFRAWVRPNLARN